MAYRERGNVPFKSFIHVKWHNWLIFQRLVGNGIDVFPFW